MLARSSLHRIDQTLHIMKLLVYLIDVLLVPALTFSNNDTGFREYPAKKFKYKSHAIIDENHLCHFNSLLNSTEKVSGRGEGAVAFYTSTKDSCGMSNHSKSAEEIG